KRAPQIRALPLPRKPERNDLPLRVNSRVGTPGGVSRDRRAFKPLERVAQRVLDRRLPRLRLPAKIICAVVCQSNPIFHRNRDSDGMLRPVINVVKYFFI